MIKLDLSDRTNMFYWQTNRRISAKVMKEIFLDRSKSFDKSVIKPAVEYGMQKAGKSKKESKVVEIGDLITDGLVNNVLRVRIADETEVIFRMHPKGVKNGYFWAESVAAFKAIEKGVSTYTTYIIVDDREKFDFDFMIMEALPGETMRNFTKSGEIEYQWEEQLIRQTGKYLGLIHQVKPKGFGFFDNQVAKKEQILKGQYKTFKEHIFAALDNDLDNLEKFKTIKKAKRKK